ncbi:LLM class flavin-dependent oxidoreductase [Bacillus sp. T33-2]|uniref:LLM class flavin-dependent oxidoreductase n=1 Tax=Bacillus sp. T33-2 TaxID=2054168 RepID=UPI000C756B55|nr:LLM class flavin-dependent oxidoreductase [Bacillus sp. T33-2]PLR95290.1 LLM class flavin-dependent oxidoreductase [Bacillus sp. T33-2]
MKISILDQSPISTNQTAKEALFESVKLAQVAEALGYERYWIAEHHDLAGLACSAPEVMLSLIGAKTNTIRIGSGAVLLPHYKPYKVAEVYNMLAVLFPGRIDIGIGRAPGGSAEATNALSDNFLQQVWRMPELVKDLLCFLDNDFPSGHEYVKLTAAPLPDKSPMPFLLGTGKKSALLAAENGMAYTFGKFMSDSDGTAIIKQYIDSFQPKRENQRPYVILAVSAICAETTEKAEETALSPLIWGLQKSGGQGANRVPSISEAKQHKLDDKEKVAFDKMKQNLIIGNPAEVTNKLNDLRDKYKADEIMIVTITHSPEDRIQSYRLIANEYLQQEKMH